MPVLFEKNVFDPIDAEQDGLRILATRFWPRGVRKAAADLYLPDLAPSKELVQAFKAGGMQWRTFASRYRAEMKGQSSLLRTLAWLSESKPVTVMCACESPDECHRSLLADLIERAGKSSK